VLSCCKLLLLLATEKLYDLSLVLRARALKHLSCYASERRLPAAANRGSLHFSARDGAPCHYSDAAPIALNESFPGHSTGSEELFTRLQSSPDLILHSFFV
jgi:hypothetical protein